MTKTKEGDSPLMPLVNFMQNFKNAMNTISYSREENNKGVFKNYVDKTR